MGKAPNKDGDANSKQPSPTTVLVTSIADTTWRMFVPTIGMLLLGRMIDSSYQTKPWGMVVGVVIGSLVAGLLIKKQLEKEV